METSFKRYFRYFTSTALMMFAVAWIMLFVTFSGASLIFFSSYLVPGIHPTGLFNNDPLHLTIISYGCLAYFYCLYPVLCIFYFLKVLRVTPEQNYRAIWAILPLLNIILFLVALFATLHLDEYKDKIFRKIHHLPAGSYLQTCQNCQIQGSILNCDCANRIGFARGTSFDLHQAISGKELQNCNGQLMSVDTCPP